MKKTLGAYDLVRPLGRGGMGEVYLAVHRETRRSVALKVSRPDRGARALARLEREARLLERVRCPYLPTFEEFFRAGETAVLVMELVRGEALRSRMVRQPGPRARLALARQVAPGMAGALRALARVGVVHRDIKPANIVLADAGEGGAACRAVLVDLGGAWADDVATLTRTGALVGTPAYFTPEMLSDTEEVGPASDLYQLALVLYDLLVGRPLMERMQAYTEAMQRSLKKFRDPRKERPWLPGELVEWILEALHPDPRVRPEPGKHLVKLVGVADRATLGRGAPPEDDSTGELDVSSLSALPALRASLREQGWKEGAAPEAPAAATPPRRGFSYGILAGLLLSFLLLGGGLFWLVLPGPSSSVAAEPPPPTPLRFTMEAQRLVLREGLPEGRTLMLREPFQAPFLADVRGRRVLELPAGFRTRTLLRLGDERLAVPAVELAANRGWHLERDPAGTWLVLDIPEPGGLQVELVADGTRFTRQIPEDAPAGLRLPLLPACLRRPTELLFCYGERALLERRLPLGEWIEARLAALEFPAIDLARAHDAHRARRPTDPPRRSAHPPRVARFLERHGAELAVVAGLPDLPEARRQELYEALAPARHVEWMARAAMPVPDERATRALGSLLRLGELPRLAPRAGGQELVEQAVGREVRVGPEARFRRLLGGEEGAAVAPGASEEASRRGHLDAEGAFHLPLELPAGDLLGLELGLRYHGGEGWHALRVELPGGRHLQIPLGEERGARFHRLPVAWLGPVGGEAAPVLVVSPETAPGYQVPEAVALEDLRIRYLVAAPRP